VEFFSSDFPKGRADMKFILLLCVSLLLAVSASACLNRQGAVGASNASTSSNANSAGAADANSGGPESAEQPKAEPGRIFRGTIADKQVEMKIRQDPSNKETIAGSYSYGTAGKPLILKGRLTSGGRLEMQEFDGDKETGEFDCKLVDKPDEQPAATIEGKWSRPDGSHDTGVELTEQHIEVTGSSIITKSMADREKSITAYYPQLQSAGPAGERFNKASTAIVTKAVNEYKGADPPAGQSSLDISYNVLLATDDLASVEFAEYSNTGGAHPDNSYETVTVDLRHNSEVKLDDIFKPKSGYETAISRLSLAKMNKEAKKLEGDSAGQNDEPVVTAESVESPSGWGLTRTGVVLYYELPHAIAALGRVFIPYREVKEYLNPNGPASSLYRP
jgi:hypothetical protein